ncbi:MAG: twin-arginine translocation signal domain-containing protein [Candidatus Krumholzibacteria bacterium]|nr:twin-arginine translocation signal domain-containing protein [Candidatus Krumholzibacteria bacterium]
MLTFTRDGARVEVEIKNESKGARTGSPDVRAQASGRPYTWSWQRRSSVEKLSRRDFIRHCAATAVVTGSGVYLNPFEVFAECRSRPGVGQGALSFLWHRLLGAGGCARQQNHGRQR